MSAQNTLSINGLHATRGRKNVFEGINFAASSGQIVQILGPNGSGKSTLLRILAGLALPEAGTVSWNGSDVHRKGQESYKPSCLYLGHKIGISGDQTALENLALFAEINADRSGLTVIDALQKLDYSASPSALCSKVSAGQQQRVALAKLLVVKAPLWLLDEPFTALDSEGKQLVESLIAEHCANDGIAIVATHQTLESDANRIQNVYLQRP